MLTFSQFIAESKTAPLYHALSIDYAVHALTNNVMYGTSRQRYDPKGNILADPDFKYGARMRFQYMKKPKSMDPEIAAAFKNWDQSVWMYGISFTRSFAFAQQWNQVVFEIDQQKLTQRYKLLPWNWGSSGNMYKKEQEEFLPLKKMVTKKYADKHLVRGSDDLTKFPKLPELDKYLTAIYVESPSIISSKQADVLLSHPLLKIGSPQTNKQRKEQVND